MSRINAPGEGDRGAVETVELLWLMPLLFGTVLWLVLFSSVAWTAFAAKQSVNEGTQSGARLLARSGANVTVAEGDVRKILDRSTTSSTPRFREIGSVVCTITDVAAPQVRLLECTARVKLNIPILANLPGVNSANPWLELSSAAVVEEAT